MKGVYSTVRKGETRGVSRHFSTCGIWAYGAITFDSGIHGMAKNKINGLYQWIKMKHRSKNKWAK